MELDGKQWEEYSGYYRGIDLMDFNDGNCYWREAYGNCSITGSDYKIPE